MSDKDEEIIPERIPFTVNDEYELEPGFKVKRKVKNRIQKGFSIDWKLIADLAAIFCTHKEIEHISGNTIEVLQGRAEAELGMPFSDFIDQHRSSGQMSLRRKQYQVAMQGNVPMLIWLGKQFLEQRDKTDTKVLMEPKEERERAINAILAKLPEVIPISALTKSDGNDTETQKGEGADLADSKGVPEAG